MKNVISILIDSMCSDNVGKTLTGISSTPFIDLLKNNSIYAQNVYSYGPYTDAATKGLYCSSPTLNNYGFYYGLNAEKSNHYKVFKEAGYETYGIYYPYYLISKKTSKYIDHSIYNSGFCYESVWNGKFKYYSEKKKTNKLTRIEYVLLEKQVNMVFDSWKTFYNNAAKTNQRIISKIKVFNNDISSGVLKLDEEIQKFNNNKLEYIDSLLEQGMDHDIAKINEYDWNKQINKKNVKRVCRNNRLLFSRIFFYNFYLNIKNRNIKIKNIFYRFLRFLCKKEKKDLRYVINSILLLFSPIQLEYKSLKKNWKYECSANAEINEIINIIKERNNEKPFYISMHAEDPHNYMSFFSYDSDDYNTIAEEIEYIKPLIYGCSKEFKGNLVYQLSLRYIDICIKRLYDFLEAENLLDDTIVLITADHGSSYTFNPIRDSVVNNFYTENYKIPLIIYNKDMKENIKGEYKGMYSSADIFTTLYDIANVESGNVANGLSIIKNGDGRKYIITEYTGPGCPDLLSKEVWISIRNREYILAYIIDLKKPIIDKPVELYDVVNDPKQLHNICYKYEEIYRNNDCIKEMVFEIKKRFNEIMDSTNSFIENINNFVA